MITSPVYIGKNVKIGPYATVGPNVVIGDPPRECGLATFTSREALKAERACIGTFTIEEDMTLIFCIL